MLTIPLAAAEMTADEQAVWRLEEQYWVYVAKSDLDGYLTLWDERFVGWPSFSPKPVGKDGIGGWIRRCTRSRAEIRVLARADGREELRRRRGGPLPRQGAVGVGEDRPGDAVRVVADHAHLEEAGQHVVIVTGMSSAQ